MPAVILRGWGLTSSPLWYDEAYTALLAGLPFDRMMTAIIGDVHPPLYYLMVADWGSSPLGLRSFSLFLSVLALVIFWLVLHELDLSKPARMIA